MAAPFLVNAIKLRSLVDQLNNVEFTQFLSELVHLCGRNIILTPLFHQLTASSQTTLTQIQPDIIENIIEITRNIIRSRKDEPQKTISTATFNSLSGNLIGELASYLEHTDYICFSKVNRAAMIHCNTPNTLRCLDIFYEKTLPENESFDLQRYPSINRLFCALIDFDKLRLSEESVANNLQNLYLDCDDADVNNMQAFMNQNFINLNNIKSLSLCFVYSGDAALWRKILLKFPMIQHLFLCHVSIENLCRDMSDTDIQTLFVNLKGLSLSCSANLTNKFLRVYGNKLEYLCFKGNMANMRIDSNISFTKLQQLQSGLTDTKVINAILKTAKQLRKVSVTSGDKNIIKKIISSQPLLEYIHIEYPLHCTVAFAGIESGLYNTKKINRKRFKISVELSGSNLKKQPGSNLILRIAGIINILSQLSKVNEFMFVLRFETWSTSKKKAKEIIKAVDDFRECQKSAIVVKTHCDDTFHFIVITNKDCKINGFSESWMFDAVDI